MPRSFSAARWREWRFVRHLLKSSPATWQSQCPLPTGTRPRTAEICAKCSTRTLHSILRTEKIALGPGAIRWDFLRETIQELEGCTLIPVTAAYFEPHKVAEEIHRPDKFLAGGGHGKSAAGFASVVPQNDHLVLAKVRRLARVALGTVHNFREDRTAIGERRKTFLPGDTAKIAGRRGSS